MDKIQLDSFIEYKKFLYENIHDDYYPEVSLTTAKLNISSLEDEKYFRLAMEQQRKYIETLIEELNIGHPEAITLYIEDKMYL